MEAGRIYLISGLIRRACTRGFWPILFVRLVTELDLSPLQLVLLGTVMELSILVFEIPTGVVADLKSRRLSVVVSYLVMGTAMIIAAVAEPYWLLVLSQILIGFGNTFETGAETAWLTGEVGGVAKAEPLILRRGRLQLVAGVAGIAVFAAIGALTSTSTALVIIGTVMGAWGVALAVTMPEEHFTPSRSAGLDGLTRMLRTGWAQINSVAPMRTLAIAIFIGGLAKEAIDRLDVQRLDDVGLPEGIEPVAVIGIVVAINSLLAAGLLLVTRARAIGGRVVSLLASLQLATAAGIAVLAQVDILFVAAAGLIVQGGAFAAMEPLVVTWTNAFADDDARATVHSFIGQAEAFGEILGGIALGIVAGATSVATAMTISAVLFGTASLLTRRVNAEAFS